MLNKNNDNDNDNKNNCIILYRDNIRKFLGFTDYKIFCQKEKYTIISEKDTSLFYITSYMKKINNVDMYHIDLKSNFIRSLGKDCYAIGLGKKEYMYNASTNCFIGKPHDKIYPGIFQDKYLIIVNQDYVTDGEKIDMKTSFCNHDGKNLADTYTSISESDYDKIQIIDIDSEINKHFAK